MRTLKAIRKTAIVLGGFALALHTYADTTAFVAPVGLSDPTAGNYRPDGLQGPNGTGSGGVPFNLSMEFTVNTSVKVTSLGAYDATITASTPNGTGFASPVQVGIFDEDTGLVVTPTVNFIGTAGTVVGSARFVGITPVTLNAGDTYQIIASDYGGLDGGGNPVNQDYNFFYDFHVNPTATDPLIFNDGGGELTLGQSFYSENGVFGTPADGDQNYQTDQFNGQYAAGTFTFAPVPEPSVAEIGLLGVALLGVFKFGRRFRKSTAV